MKLIKQIVTLKLIFIFFTNIAYAETKNAEKFIEKFTDKVYKIISKEENVANIRAELIDLISKNIDIEITAKFVLGKYWNQASELQKEKFKKLFEEYLILNYAPKFQGYNDESFEIIETKLLAPERYSSKINIVLSDKTNFEIVLYIIEQNRKFKIVDIAGEGISFSAVQRTEFYAIIENNGIEKFLEILKQKILELKN
jgi:phospholipid transport system substrate-binding protein